MLIMNKIKRFTSFGRFKRGKFVNNNLVNKQLYSATTKDVQKVLLLISFPFYNKKSTLDDSLNKIIDTVDKLTEKEQYDEAYNIIINTADCSNIEIIWRTSKLLYLKSQSTNDVEEAKYLINEAYDLLDLALKEGGNCAKVHKWKAIVLDMKLKYMGILYKATNLHLLKYHLDRAVELDPSDITSLFLLGMWHYELAFLTSFQKMLINLLSSELINPTFDEALTCFESIENLKPRKYISNLYMLGKINYELKRYYHARYYLKIASSMDTQNEYDSKNAALARILAYRLKSYVHTYDDYVNHIK